ncbi:MAG TPA: UDP-2,3-diacylglucosamine diphosphatase [Thermoanaerobaculia bacterium]|jgi:UDP-2,3-diacylglucosamine hydrolase|nr:UDP-2,3-diacylglucosamine diphosphatase [Thermoanaerobaculia bacterium]
MALPATPGERVAVIADSHLGGPGGAIEPMLAQLVALPGEGVGRLILLGDIFQAWVGLPRFETPEIARFVAALRELRRQGLRVDYIEGNRDFFLAKSPYRDAFDFIGLETSFEAGGVRYLAVHGDGLNDRDWQYRTWRRMSKSLPVELALRTLPRRLAHRMVTSTDRRLANTNFKHRAELPEAAIRTFAERRLAEGHDVLLLGHFHEGRIWPVGQGEVRLLEAWFKSRRVERFG